MIGNNNIIRINVAPDADEYGRRLYTITLYKFEDLDSLYHDMENPGSSPYIPNRVIPVVNPRPLSVNTDYRLTEEEAEQIRQDPRVWAVELHISEINSIRMNHWTLSSNNWDKSAAVANGMQNWALLRCFTGAANTQWGTNATPNTSGTVTFTTSGKNVDFIHIQGNIPPNHPEFAVNPDGTGGSRVVQLDWLQKYSANVTGVQTSNSYLYTSNTWSDHETFCVSVAAGNSKGWARDANIYTIGTAMNDNFSSDPWPYVTYWHQNKPINPVTGRRNPTVANSSWGEYYFYSKATRFDGNTANGIISSIRVGGVVANTYNWSIIDFQYPGAKTNNAITFTTLNTDFAFNGPDANGYYSFNWNAVPTAWVADIQNMLAAGVIYTVSAGNDEGITNVYSANTSDHYNDYVVLSNQSGPYATIYHNRGSLGGIPGVINVGATDSTGVDQKAQFSTVGNKVDIFAPGVNLLGAAINNSGVTDYRNSSYYIEKGSGTSFSAPTVAGMIACLMETYPTINANNVLQYLNGPGTTKNQLANNYIWYPSPQFTTYWSLLGANNNYLYYNKERQDQGDLYPKENVFIKPSSGQTFPRPRVKQI